MAAKVKLQGQEFPIPDDLIALPDDSEEAKRQRDNRLKRWLSQVSPAATNATLQWKEENGETIIQVTPQLGTKGGIVVDPVMEALIATPQVVHPVFSLAVELKMRLAARQLDLPSLLRYQSRIDEALSDGHDEERKVEAIYRRLSEVKATASPWVPLGF